MKAPPGPRRRRPPRPAVSAPAPTAAARPARGRGWIVALAAAALAAFVHRASLGAFFTTDDLILFERLRGLVPWVWTPWRLVSGRLYYLLAFPLFGTDPLPWHVVNLALHALNAALVSAWAIRLGLRGPAALLAGGLFGATASAMTVTWSMSSIGELLACTCALAGLLALSGERPRARLAWAAFGLGLLAKESIVLVPLAACLAAPAGVRAARLRAAAPVLAAGALLWAYILLARDRTGSLQGEAYAFGFGTHLITNMRDYAAWALDRLGMLPATGVASAAGGLAGLLALVVLLAAAWSMPAVAAGMAVFVLGLLPVLPLSHHWYIHYLYLPFAGWSVALAAVLDDLARRRGAGREAWGAAALALSVAAACGADAIGRAATTRNADGALLLDTFARRMDVCRNACESLGRELPAEANVLVILRPAEGRQAMSVRTGRAIAAPSGSMARYDLLSGTLDEGRGLRALFPALRDVRFADTLAAGDSAATLSTASTDGRMVVTGRGNEGVPQIADIWVRNRMRRSAADLLRSALAIWPADMELQWRLKGLGGHGTPPPH